MTDPTSPEAIAEREAKATPGPWEFWDDPTGEDWAIGRPEEVPGELGDSSQYIGSVDEQADADFIANARQDIPALLAALEAERVAREESERDADQLLRERDDAIDWADKLAYSIAPQSVIGEHSSMNNPWENALEARDAAEAALEAKDGEVARATHLLRWYVESNLVEAGDEFGLWDDDVREFVRAEEKNLRA